MKLVVGLGNPGKKYKDNRHNVGFVVADRLRTTVYGDVKWKVEPKFEAVVCRPLAVDVLLAKPTTFMNESGRAVKKLVDFYKIHTGELYIIHDDLDIPLGSYKIQKGKGPRQHKGVGSVEQALGTKDFWHVRVGIENRPASAGAMARQGKEYVLEDFTEDERQILDKVVKEICLTLMQ